MPGTKVEVEKIGSMFDEKNIHSSIFIGEQATETSVKELDKAGIIHLASHGYFLSDVAIREKNSAFGVDVEKAMENPLLRSGILFTGSTKAVLGKAKNKPGEDNGILTAYEAMNLNLENTRLVVLSACETGLGTVKNGEGVYGLQRSFQVAGAKSIIMSLWKINDDATQFMMTTFYEFLLSGNDYYDAFTKAQRALRDKYDHPYFWGAFVYVGS